MALFGCVREWPVYYPPAWSPDGSKLYYATARPDGKLAIREVDTASGTGAELALGQFATPPVAIALSPQGDKVACAVVAREKDRSPTLRLHILSRAGGGDRAAWEAPCERGLVDLCWLPDGLAVVLATDRPGGDWALVRVPADGGAAQAIVADLAEVRAPTVSPDGASVAFVARAERSAPWSLYVASADGGRRRLAAPAIFAEFAVGYWPAWSPRGEAVAYVAERGLTRGFAEVWTWDAATGERRLLAQSPSGACIAPAWSPDAKSVAVTSLPFGPGSHGPGSDGRPSDIVIVPAAGGSAQTLAADGLANLMPAWSPNGRVVAFHTCGDPAAEPHVVRLADAQTGTLRLAEDTPEGRFLVALARHRRSGSATPASLAGLAAQVTKPLMAAFATTAVAEAHAARGEWPAAAQHALKAGLAATAEGAGATPIEIQRRALRTLVTAQMRLGEPRAALASADRLLALGEAEDARPLRDGLAQGIEAAARLEEELKNAPLPALALALADAHLRQLGNPRKAADILFRLLKESPDGPHVRPAAEALLACHEQLPPGSASYRVLEWAAGKVGEGDMTPPRLVLLGEVAAANGEPRAALRWLGRLPKEGLDAALSGRAAQAWLRAGQQLASMGAPAEALDAFRRAEATGPCPAAAAAALQAAKLLLDAGNHPEAARSLLAAIGPHASSATAREAGRLLAAARIQRRDPLSYDIAEVAQLVGWGFLDRAVARGEQLMATLPPGEPSREALRRHVAEGFHRLVAWHLARGDARIAGDAAARWLRLAARDDDLPRALAALARCHELAGDRRGLVETLSRLALEFPQRPEGAEARRQLLRLDTK